MTTETTTTSVEATKAPAKKTAKKAVAAKGAAKKGAKKAPAKKSEPTKSTNGLTKRETAVLECLKKLGPSTRAAIKEHCEMQGGLSKIMGAPTNDSVEADTLLGRKLIKCETEEGTRGLLWTITAAGEKLLAK